MTNFTTQAAVLHPPLSKSASSFTLNTLGVAGFFGGDSAVNGMATANLVPLRRWVGWYNTPGSYEIAKKFGPLAKWKVCAGLFPGGEHDPARLFGIHGKEGPTFIAVHSGSNFPRTGHLAYLIMKEAQGTEVKSIHDFGGDSRRKTTYPSVTVVNLTRIAIPPDAMQPLFDSSLTYSAYLAFVPVLVSLAGCVLCGLLADWFCLASIALGVVANGSACFLIGSGELKFAHHLPVGETPPGDGVLKGDSDLVVLIGEEGTVNTFMRGRFHLQYRDNRGEPRG